MAHNPNNNPKKQHHNQQQKQQQQHPGSNSGSNKSIPARCGPASKSAPPCGAPPS